VLVELAEQAGLPRIEFAALRPCRQHAATAADFTWVQDLGIAGFPTLLAERNGQLALLTNGYQPLESRAAARPLAGARRLCMTCPIARPAEACRSAELGGNPPPGPASQKSLWIANGVAVLATLCSVPIPLLLPLLVDEVLLGHGDAALKS
jgi:hypothetical protein